MNNCTFEDELQATWRRVSKRAARSAYERNERITLVPCNYRPFGMWHVGYTTNEHDHDVYTFDQLVNSFEFYNCNNEAGRYASFYVLDYEAAHANPCGRDYGYAYSQSTNTLVALFPNIVSQWVADDAHSSFVEVSSYEAYTLRDGKWSAWTMYGGGETPSYLMGVHICSAAAKENNHKEVEA